MSKDTDSTLVVRINEGVASAALLSLYGGNDEDLENHDMVSNIESEVSVL